MRNKQKTSMINKQKTSVTLKPSRKIRTRTRKPKFLSLRLQLSPENTQMTSTAADDDHHQLTLFPLHPENFVGADRDTHDENVADFFSAADGGATSLTGLLDEDDDTVSPPSYSYVAQDRAEGNPLLRTALRNRERDGGAVEEEKWVCYSEVVERKEEEVSSCAADLSYANESRSLALKLDYDQILNAWSDKGSLYIHVESPQTVPELHHTANGQKQSWDSNGGSWTVPEMSGSNSSGHGSIQVKMEAQGEEWKMMGQREASVLRYKEKRRNRLFSKKIRYEVRKLNAEKRPRIKGRFVKRN